MQATENGQDPRNPGNPFRFVEHLVGIGGAFVYAVPALSIFSPEPDVLETAVRYLRIFVIGLPAVGIMMAVGAALRGAGDTGAR